MKKTLKIPLLFTLCSALFLGSCTGKSSFFLEFGSDVQPERINVQSFSGSKYYSFTKQQKELIEAKVQEEGNASLLVTVYVGAVKKNSADPLQRIGFLYEEDFSGSGVKSELPSRPVAAFNALEFEKSSLSIKLSFDREKTVPRGFFIQSQSSVSVTSAAISAAAMGYDFRKPVPLYAFAANGGYISKNSNIFDFGGAASSFSVKTSDNALMPQFEIFFSQEIQQEQVKILSGGEKLTLRNPKNEALSVMIPSAALKSPFSVLEILENPQLVTAVLLTAADSSLLAKASSVKKSAIIPLKVDPGLIIDWPETNWRSKDYELFEWDRFEKVLLFDFANYSVQDDFLRRLAYFTEKKGFRGQLLSDDFLKDKHGYNAHDYSAESLAKFFTKVNETKFPVNKREMLLKEILIANQIISEDETSGICTPVSGALISISKESPSYNRNALLSHEGWHGIFFIDEEFRNVSASIFYTMDQGSMDFLIRYFDTYPSLSYDTSDIYLMKNEFMAYMLQRPVKDVAKYFVNIAQWHTIQANCKNEADYVIKTQGEFFTSAAQLFDEYVADRWNLGAGRIGLITR